MPKKQSSKNKQMRKALYKHGANPEKQQEIKGKPWNRGDTPKIHKRREF